MRRNHTMNFILSQPSTTLDIYTHAFDKNKKAASAELQGMLEI